MKIGLINLNSGRTKVTQGTRDIHIKRNENPKTDIFFFALADIREWLKSVSPDPKSPYQTIEEYWQSTFQIDLKINPYINPRKYKSKLLTELKQWLYSHLTNQVFADSLPPSEYRINTPNTFFFHLSPNDFDTHCNTGVTDLKVPVGLEGVRILKLPSIELDKKARDSNIAISPTYGVVWQFTDPKNEGLTLIAETNRIDETEFVLGRGSWWPHGTYYVRSNNEMKEVSIKQHNSQEILSTHPNSIEQVLQPLRDTEMRDMVGLRFPDTRDARYYRFSLGRIIKDDIACPIS